MRRQYEKPQRRNPHQLAIRQHVWPKRSIARFACPDGTVKLFDKRRSLTRAAIPDDDIFCAQRVWDQRAEAGYMKGIEDDFQQLADQVITGAGSTIDAAQKAKIDAFYALWTMRAKYRYEPDDEIQLKGAGGFKWTKDEEERFERVGASYMREGGKIPARVMHGLYIQRAIDGYLCDLGGVQWGVIRCQEGHLLVPDYPTYTIIPITPTICLSTGGQTGVITKQNLAEINAAFRAASHDYFFAQDLALCP